MSALALEFLDAWHRGGPWSLGAIDPDDSSASGHEWLTTSDIAEAAKFIEEQGARRRNIYYQTNLTRPDLGTLRAHRNSIVVAVAVQAEVDPPKSVSEAGNPLAALGAWQLEYAENVLKDEFWAGLALPRPNLILFSGSGYQLVWRLAEPVVLWHGEPLVQDAAAIATVESRNRKLVEVLGADAASTDVSRLLRLPGTLNWPGKSKREKYGRFDPVPAEIIELDFANLCPIATLPVAAGPTPRDPSEPIEIREFTGAPDGDRLLAAAEALAKAWPTSGRHQAQLALAGALARAGWPIQNIAEFCAAVAELQEPGNAKLEKRLTAARTSVEKLASGGVIAGWPTVIEHVGDAAVDAAVGFLGLPGRVVDDPVFVASMAAHVTAAVAATPAPSSIDFDSTLKSAQKRLAGRKDIESIKQAELLKRVNNSEFLTDDANEDRRTALAMAAIAVARAAPVGTTPEQMERKLLPSAGALAMELPEVVAKAIEFARTMPPLLARQPAQRAPTTIHVDAGGAVIDELVLEIQGPRAGRPVASSQHNAEVALQRLNVSFHYDRFSRRKLIERDGVRDVVEDHHVNGIMFEVERLFDFFPPKDKFFDYCTDRARHNSFHPVLDYIDALAPWDGTPRLETWLIDHAGAPDTPYVRAVSRLVLVAAVRRVRQPGCKFDEMLILEGDQGTMKSSALAELCPDRAWFTDDMPLSADTKTRMEKTAGKWIVEAGELKGKTVADQNTLKSFLSSSVDESRMSYAREPTGVPRQFIVIGTTNDAQYLSDPTGDRRYWPIAIIRFDVETLKAARDQIWAEAATLDLQHPEATFIRLHPSLWAAAAEEQDKRKVDEPYQIMIEDVLGGLVGTVRIQDVWKIAGFDISSGEIPSRGEQMQIAAIMRTLGWKRDRRVVGGSRAYYYSRGEGAQVDISITIGGNPSTGWQVKSMQPTHTVTAGLHQGAAPGQTN